MQSIGRFIACKCRTGYFTEMHSNLLAGSSSRMQPIACQTLRGPPTPIFFSFQLTVSCRSNTCLVRESNCCRIPWFSWRCGLHRRERQETEQNRARRNETSTGWTEERAGSQEGAPSPLPTGNILPLIIFNMHI